MKIQTYCSILLPIFLPLLLLMTLLLFQTYCFQNSFLNLILLLIQINSACLRKNLCKIFHYFMDLSIQKMASQILPNQALPFNIHYLFLTWLSFPIKFSEITDIYCLRQATRNRVDNIIFYILKQKNLKPNLMLI